jgi:hypothetical protein
VDQFGNPDLNQAHYLLLIYLMAKDREEDADEKLTDFKNSVLIHRPEIYAEVFGEKQEEEPEWMVPRTEGEFLEVRDLMRQIGFG